jgi:hypothetical protein
MSEDFGTRKRLARQGMAAHCTHQALQAKAPSMMCVLNTVDTENMDRQKEGTYGQTHTIRGEPSINMLER